jgi:hypothetical protein
LWLLENSSQYFFQDFCGFQVLVVDYLQEKEEGGKGKRKKEVKEEGSQTSEAFQAIGNHFLFLQMLGSSC